MVGARVHHLRTDPDASAPSSLVVVHDPGHGTGGAAWIAYWGRRLHEDPPTEILTDRALPPSGIDRGARLTVLAGADEGWSGTSALAVRRPSGEHARGGTLRCDFTVTVVDEPGAIVVVHRDDHAGVRVRTRLRLDERSGMLRADHEVSNTGSVPFAVDSAAVLLPVPPRAAEILDMGGRWCRERTPQRHSLPTGTWLRSSRHGRPGHEAPLLFCVGEPGFGYRHGDTWAVHLGWSGDTDTWAERTAQGWSVLGTREALRPDELVLASGETYTTPVTYAVHSPNGLDGVTAAFHTWLRSRPEHPRTPRRIVANAWERVGLTHDERVLRAAAAEAAELGAELFLLDDGWYLGRRTDAVGLGDWVVDPDVWPGGLRAFADHVRALGMGFGLWFEPEMVNLDSHLARAHPDWVSRPSGGSNTGPMPPEWRNQQTLDLARPDVYRHTLDAISAVVADVGVDLIKWDQNRDPVVASPHAHVTAVYRMMDELRIRHPGLEIESCSAGGGRMDLGMLAHADRVWPTDTNDALERARLQWWTQVIVPPELMGSQFGAADAVHTTGRAHVLESRGIVALFGHHGFEAGAERERDGGDRREDLARWVALAARLRPDLAVGTLVHADLPDPAHLLQGIVAPDRSGAWYTLFAVDSSIDDVPPALPLPGLDPSARYRVWCAAPVDRGHGFALARSEPSWLAHGLVATGEQLAAIGVPAPALNPERGLLIRVERTPDRA